MSLKNYWLQSPLKFQISGFGRVAYGSFKLLTLAGIYQWIIHFISAFISKNLFQQTIQHFWTRSWLKSNNSFWINSFLNCSNSLIYSLAKFLSRITFNTLTFNYEYSRCNWENLLLSIQMHLSEKPKPFIKFLFFGICIKF